MVMPVDRAWMRKVWSRIQSGILRAIVDRTKDDASLPRVQAQWAADRTSADVEYMQPQGVYFRPREGAEGLFVAVAGDKAAAVLLDAQKRADTPGGDGISEGEGGLYYAGDFKVFLDSAGVIHLGAKSASDWVALAAKVKSDFDKISTRLGQIESFCSSHTHLYNPGPSTPAPTATGLPALSGTPYTASSPAATKVKAT